MGLYKAKILPPWSPAEVKKQRRMVRLLSFVTAPPVEAIYVARLGAAGRGESRIRCGGVLSLPG